ncbi:MAG: glycine cleavage system aminomethyltransferase GcvT [Chloroflexota bacterium]|nr:glycine cleavage system aminomethyltransferase GcvT [Chloroflexota bacterium]
MNQQTILCQTHLDLNARMVPFGGWDMPVQYSGIINEVKAVRTAAGIFDVSHMGRLYISGPRSGAFLDRMLTGSATGLRQGRARYCLICNESGGVIDDTIFYRLGDEEFLLIPNAGNRPAVVEWFNQWIEAEFSGGVSIDDRTTETGLIALQGPGAANLLDSLCTLTGGASPSSLRFFAWGEGELGPHTVFVGRTGYTGEDGFELSMSSQDATPVWNALMEAGALPCGLGARDVLRLEAALPLHGHEIDANTSPIEAGLDRFVRREGDYIGQPVLAQQRSDGTERRLVGLKLPGRSAPRAEYPILANGQEVGRITSGSFSPTLDTSIAMGYVFAGHSEAGTTLDVDIRGRPAAATVVPLPFYSRS